MSLTRKKFREIVFYFLYSTELQSAQDEGSFVSLAMRELKVTRQNVRQAMEYAGPLVRERDYFDGVIREAVKGVYDLERVSLVERLVLRLGIYELQREPQIPGKVAISEAMRLSVKFGSVGSEKFINAVLDRVMKQQDADK